MLNAASKSLKPLAVSYAQENFLPEKPYQDCPAPLKKDKFSPHGINVRLGDNKQHALYVVNHGGRESIEVFNLNLAGPEPSATWQGCIVVPKNNRLNSVVPLPDGGLAVTSMSDPSDKNLAEKIRQGKNTGKVLEWFSDKGWQTVSGSELSGNNGIEISPDGQWYYVTAWWGQQLIRLSRNQQPVQKQILDLDFMPDNL